MRKIFYLLICLFLALSDSYGQTCPTSNVRLATQSEVDSFSILYPECTEVNFSIRIGNIPATDPSDITNLIGLSNIEKIKGSFNIGNNPNLASLEGLENLRKINWTFAIYNNTQLSDISNLTSIDSCDFIRFHGNPMLVDYSVLDQLSYASRLRVSENNSIQSVAELPQINGLSKLDLWNCEALESLEGLSNFPLLTTLGLVNNDRIKNLSQILNLESLHSLSIVGLDSLDQLGNLFTLDTLSFLDVRSNSKLVNLEGLDSLKFVTHFTIEDNPSLESLEGLNNLRNVDIDGDSYCHLTIKDNPTLLSLSALNKLEALESISIMNNDTLQNLIGLENLKSVSYSFSIIGNDGLLTLEGYNNSKGPSIVSYSECYIFYDDFGLTIQDNSSLETLSALSHLDRIFGNLFIYNNESLKNLDGLENVESVDGNVVHLFNNSSLENLNGLAKLESIGYFSRSFLQISNNPLLTNLSGLGKLETLNETIFYINDNENLSSLFGLNDPTEIGTLILRSNPKLTNLSVLENLETISALTIFDNDLLENLDVLDGITSTINSLSLQNNDLLSDISGLKNIEAIESFDCDGTLMNGYLGIKGNPLLSECAIMPICEALISTDVDKTIENNGLSCSSPEDINCDEVSISGYVFYDLNQNGMLDAGENGVPNLGINFDPPDISRLTKQGGLYYQVCEEGVEYEITIPEFDNYTLTTPTDQYTITFEPGNNINYNNNFGIYADEEKHDVVSNISSNPTRCNERVDFFLSIENIGTYQENGTLKVDFDSLTSNFWTFPKADSVNTESNFVLWDIENFSPFDFQQIKFKLDMPDESFTNTILNFTSSITIDSAGTDITINEYTYSPTVLCSFDPNDKIVMPAGVYEENYTLKNEKLTYTVRFQNTGNAPAKDVRIVDTLDNFLDIETFRVVNSSFPPQTSINGREVTFLFSNINLVDSISDESNSHGFVTFEIYPISEIEDFSEIKNTAHIIFDFNAAIVTNTVKNTMVTTIPTNAVESQFLNSYAVYPNLLYAQQRLFIEYELMDPEMDVHIVMHNQLGQEILSKDGQNGINELDVKGLLPGIYFIGLKNKNRFIKTSKVIIQD